MKDTIDKVRKFLGDAINPGKRDIGAALSSFEKGLSESELLELEWQCAGDEFSPQEVVSALSALLDKDNLLSDTQTDHIRQLSSSYKEANTIYFEPSFIQDRKHRTEYRVHAIEVYARRLLNSNHPHQIHAHQLLTHKGQSDANKLNDLMMLSLNPGHWKARIETNSMLDIVLKQVEQAVEFIRELYVDTNGGRGLPFHIIEIVPGPQFDLEGDRLIIGLSSFFGFGPYKTVSALELRKKWKKAKMFELPGMKARLYARLAWKVLDPAGAVRQGLMGAVLEKANSLKSALEEPEQRYCQDQKALSRSLENLVKEQIDPGHIKDGQSFLKTAIHKISDMNHDQRLKLFRNWRDEVLDSSVQQQVADDSIATTLIKKSGKIDIQGLIVVGNYHDIDVTAFAGFLGNLKQQGLNNYTTTPDDLEISIKGKLLTLFFTDRVRVDSAFLRGNDYEANQKLFATATLDRALAKVSGHD